jgi:hypothetical protein
LQEQFRQLNIHSHLIECIIQSLSEIVLYVEANA